MVDEMRALGNKEDDVGGSGGGGRRSMAPTKVSMAPRVSSSRMWLESRDPRIVRASKEFGSKDRHSKVSTLKGLRDRRVRLSVSTAIQLYDLQDRLGLNRPSKVVDWLLAVAREEIDKLPPLPILPLIQLGEGSQIQRIPSSASCVEDKEGGERIQGYTYNAGQIAPIFASTSHVDEMDMGNNREFLVAHTREATSALLPSPLLPYLPGQFSFCTLGITGEIPSFVPYVSYPTTSSTNLAVDTLHADFGSHRKPPLFSSNKSLHK